VRSLKALKLTDFFLPKEYDGVVEIPNKDAYQHCKRLLQEECVIGGPSSGMALAGAFKLVPDEPGAVCVVMFPDNIFKYTGSIRKHLPELFPADASQAPPPAAVEVIGGDEATRLVCAGAALVDVRTPREYDQGHIAEAVNVPLQAIQAGSFDGLPKDKSAPIVTVCGVGQRSRKAAEILQQQGWANVKNLDGGMQLWLGEGRPLKLR
jgi:cysteine synthase B